MYDDPMEQALLDAEALLLRRRREQRGQATLGDAEDRALLAALAALPADAAPRARETGAHVGEHVYSRRFYEDTLPGSVAVLSTLLLESGAGTLRLESTFHRSARLVFQPTGALRDAPDAVSAAYAAGILEGFLAAAFNCRVQVAAASAEDLRVQLLEGRDVNHRGAPA